MQKKAPTEPPRQEELLEKSPTGIKGFDDITFGGLPKGRPTLITGGAGCGKTVFAMEFLVNGARMYNEPGVYIAFEETERDLVKNFNSLGFKLKELMSKKVLDVDHIRLERSEIQETGEYDLDGLFVRLGASIDAIGAKRVAIDTIEVLFSSLANEAIIRSELRRLFQWLKDKGVTVVITGEKGANTLTRYGLEEYVADCVISLENIVTTQIATRRLRIVKYRGSQHGPNEYPFLIDSTGISVLPITSLKLDHDVSSKRVSSGVPRLDRMLGDGGYYRGSSVLVTGTPGTGKTSLAGSFALSVTSGGERVLYFAYEESPKQILRNQKSIGINLDPAIKKDLLRFHASRPSLYGLEMHLVTMYKLIEEYQPSAIIVDPVSNLVTAGSASETNSMLTRLIDYAKTKGITGLYTSLTSAESRSQEVTEVGVSSLMDTWILLRDIEIGGERSRGLYVLKSRGMPHSNQIREFLLSSKGIELRDVYTGPAGVLTGSARLAQEATEEAQSLQRQQEIERRRREIDRFHKIMRAQVAGLEAEFEAKKEALERQILQEEIAEKALDRERERMGKARKAD